MKRSFKPLESLETIHSEHCNGSSEYSESKWKWQEIQPGIQQSAEEVVGKIVDYNGWSLLGLHSSSWKAFCWEGLPRLLVELGSMTSACRKWTLRFTGQVRWERQSSWEEARRHAQSWQWRAYAEYELKGKRSWLFLGEVPAVGSQQTFWHRGVERVVIHQLLRAPGLYWQMKTAEEQIERKLQVIAERGAHISVRALGQKVKVKLGAELHFSAKEWRTAIEEEDEQVGRILSGIYLGSYGRLRLNACLAEAEFAEEQSENPWLTFEDLRKIWQIWVDWFMAERPSDDLDGLTNKILFPVGKQIERATHAYLANFKRRWQGIVSDTQPKVHLDLAGVVVGFLAASPTSQLLDQTNPLAALAHRRRVTLLGEGGLKAGSVPTTLRNVHPSQFGRLCPIDTSEGASVGLRCHLALYAGIDRYGRIGMGVVDKKSGQHGWIFGGEDQVQAERGVLLSEGKFQKGQTEQWMWPQAMAPFSSSLWCTPFLEHTDAARAVMSAGHQCQALPLWKPGAPLIRTGAEAHVAREARMNLYATVSGTVEYVDASKIQVDKQTFWLNKFQPGNTRSSAKVQMHQKPAVQVGEQVKVGQLLADGYASSGGLLSLGANLWVAYMSWEGFNFEDGIVLSERVIREGKVRSVLMKTYEIDIKQTELGSEWCGLSLLKPEEILEAKSIFIDNANQHLDVRTGLPSVGSRIKSGDVLASRWTPKKCRKELSGEELLFEGLGLPEARFKARHVVAGIGDEGTVVDVQVLTENLPHDVNARILITVAHLSHIEVGDKLSGRHGNKGIVTAILPEEDMPVMPDGTTIDIILNPLGVPSRMNCGQVYETQLGLCARTLGRTYTIAQFDEGYGSPSESLLCAELTKARKVAPWIQSDGTVWLKDGRTGEAFDHPVCVGVQYILAQEHQVAKKEHARHQGTYDRVTGQPVAGRKAGGGQRIGEMEVWALQAHGAAYTLKEMMTVKSDDEITRSECAKRLMAGEPIDLCATGTPMALDTLIGTLRGIGLDVQLLASDG
jgi:DNA-directed RNA polymerase subunit beta